MRESKGVSVHTSVLNQVKQWTLEYDLDDADNDVLEIGSQDYNGSVRQYFPNVNEYIGTDMLPGPGVDLVLSSLELGPHFEGRQFDVVICLEVLEHDAEFWLTMDQIRYLLAPGGYLILSARGCTTGRDGRNGESMWEHGYPYDYWRFMPQSVPLLMAMGGCSLIQQVEDTQHPGFISIGTTL